VVSLVVGSRSLVSASRRSVVSTVKSGLVVVESRVRCRNSRTSVRGVVRRADVMLHNRGSETSLSGHGGDLRVDSALALVALPELHAGALGVAVGGTGTIALLLVVVLGHEELEGDGDEEEEAGRS
jgi:hypothetical protein